MITYKQLFEKLKTLNEEQLNQNVTVSLNISEEAIPVKDLVIVQKDDILDDILDVGHAVLSVDY
jgi:hypothetical protein